MSQMNGRMRPYLPELTIRDYNTYQWYLRGVRRQLYTTYGLFSCCCLRYNGVLFAILDDSLAGRPATCKKMRVPGTLVWKEMMCQTQGIRLAAQVEVLLGWHRLQDAQWGDLPLYKKRAASGTGSSSAGPMRKPPPKTRLWSAFLRRNGTRPMCR